MFFWELWELLGMAVGVCMLHGVLMKLLLLIVAFIVADSLLNLWIKKIKL